MPLEADVGLFRTVTSGGSFGASPLQQHVGLGAGARRVAVEIYWPASGTRQTFSAVPRNTVIEIREGSDTFETIARKALPLRRAARGGVPPREHAHAE